MILSLGISNLVRDLRRIFFLLLLIKIRILLIPVIHQDHIVFGQPYGSRSSVIQDNSSAVCSKDDRRCFLQGINDHLIIQAGIRAVTNICARFCPRPIRASLMKDGTRGSS